MAIATIGEMQQHIIQSDQALLKLAEENQTLKKRSLSPPALDPPAPPPLSSFSSSPGPPTSLPPRSSTPVPTSSNPTSTSSPPPPASTPTPASTSKQSSAQSSRKRSVSSGTPLKSLLMGMRRASISLTSPPPVATLEDDYDPDFPPILPSQPPALTAIDSSSTATDNHDDDVEYVAKIFSKNIAGNLSDDESSASESESESDSDATSTPTSPSSSPRRHHKHHHHSHHAAAEATFMPSLPISPTLLDPSTPSPAVTLSSSVLPFSQVASRTAVVDEMNLTFSILRAVILIQSRYRAFSCSKRLVVLSLERRRTSGAVSFQTAFRRFSARRRTSALKAVVFAERERVAGAVAKAVSAYEERTRSLGAAKAKLEKEKEALENRVKTAEQARGEVESTTESLSQVKARLETELAEQNAKYVASRAPSEARAEWWTRVEGKAERRRSQEFALTRLLCSLRRAQVRVAHREPEGEVG